MSTSPVTLMVARRVASGRYQDLIAWLREGEQLATDFPGYLGSGVLAPPPGDDEFQIIFRFADEQTLHAWEHSASRTAWLGRGSDLFAHPSEHRVSGIDGWFGAAGQRPPRFFIPLSTHLLAGLLNNTPGRPLPAAPSTQNH